MSQQTIDILLATYNGAQFLEEQLSSIERQTHEHWKLIISDDGSVDDTLSILRSFINKHSQKSTLIEQENKGNASDNFLSLLQHSKSNYIAFCDQDDVWKEDKLEKSLDLLLKVEESYKKALVFSDLTVVDNQLKTLDESFMKSQRLNPEWRKDSYKMFAQSIAAGCTMLFTKELVQQLHPIDSAIFQHDHWLMMHAAHYGKIEYLNEKTVLYRQHVSNSVGANKVGTGYYTSKLTTIETLLKRWSYIKKQFRGKPIKWKIAKEKLTINLNRLFK